MSQKRREVLDGRSATIAYLNEKFELVDEADADLVKVIFDDGEILFLSGQPVEADEGGEGGEDINAESTIGDARYEESKNPSGPGDAESGIGERDET